METQVPFRLREPSQCSHEILKTGLVQKSSHLVRKLFLSLSHVVVRISLEYAAAQMPCLRREGFHDMFSSFTSKMSD